ncbi:MAG: ion transporter [Methanotrichaceae archaeon]|nr:ion transporter [Methanotrichaceae archaeon]
MDLKTHVYGVLEPGDKDSKYFDPFIMGLIILNVIAVTLSTVHTIYLRYAVYFDYFELFSVAVFSVEYILRLWTCTVDPRYQSPVFGRLRYMATPMAIVDLVAVLPFYIPLIFPDLRFLRAIRLLRLFRILKMVRYSESLKTFTEVLRIKKEELGVMFFIILMLLIVASAMIYEAEHNAQPEAFSSIPAAMWWGVVTLTTVGYGDIYPITPLGKLIGTVVVILGIGLFALPAGILASGFMEVLQQKRERRKIVCPYCGRCIDGGENDTVYIIDDGPAKMEGIPPVADEDEAPRI